MIRTILSITLVFTVAATSAVHANPPSKRSTNKKTTSKAGPKMEPATPLASGWSYSNGVWTHIDGYKLVNGEVVRSGVQTHKKAPPPPTKAEMETATKKKPTAKTPADTAAEKAAQRERNLAPRPAPQTGSHL